MNRRVLVKNAEAVSPVIAIILMVAITVVLAGVLYVWVMTMAPGSEEQAPTNVAIQLRDVQTVDLNASNTSQKIAVLDLQRESLPWSNIDIMVSRDGASWVNVKTSASTLGLATVTCPTGSGSDQDSTSWEVGESVIIREGGTNWDPLQYPRIYVKVIWKPTKAEIYNNYVQVA